MVLLSVQYILSSKHSIRYKLNTGHSVPTKLFLMLITFLSNESQTRRSLFIIKFSNERAYQRWDGLPRSLIHLFNLQVQGPE